MPGRCLLRGMNVEEMRSVVDKIRDAGCLSERELLRQTRMVDGWDALMRVDERDRQWETELKKHVCRVASLGRPHVPGLGDVAVYALLGLLCGGCGLFLVSQMRQGIAAAEELRWLAVGLRAGACVLFFMAWQSFAALRRFQPVQMAYERGRREDLERLAKEHRPGARLCLKCLKYTE